MAARTHSEVKCEPNLTPMLDVVFQLMTFFLMVMNFSQDDYDARVRLPVAGSAREINPDQVEDRLVLNIDRDGRLLIAGQPYDTEQAIKELGVQAALVRLNAKVAGDPIEVGQALPTKLVVRGDKAMKCGQLNRIVTACQELGFRTFEFKAEQSAN